MMGELIARNLLHRPMRTLIGVMAVAVEVALVVLIVGLTSGLLQETAKRIEGIGADIMVQPPAASVFLGFSGSPMPMKIGARLAALKYVQSVAPALLQFNSTGGVEMVYGIEPESFRAVSGGFVFLKGRDMEGPDDMLVDDWAARAKKLKVGDTYNLLNHDWHVVGDRRARQRRAHFRSARHFAGPGRRSRQSFDFSAACTRPEHTDDVMDEIASDLARAIPFGRCKDFLSLLTSTNVPGLKHFIHSMIGAGIVHRPACHFSSRCTRR